MQARKVDSNQRMIVTNLRKIPNLSVFCTHMVGKGFPDIVVGYKGKNYLFEIKDGSKSESQRKLTIAEHSFFMNWRGQVNVANSLDDILNIIN